MSNPRIFETTDFYLSTFLVAKDIPLVDVRPSSDSRRKVFVFLETPSLEILIARFWSKKELVEPILLLSSQKELKRRLYGEFERFGKAEE